MSELKALCMSCREEVDGKSKPTMQVMKDPVVGRMKNKKTGEETNRFSAQGACSKCSGKMFKFLSKDDAEKMM